MTYESLLISGIQKDTTASVHQRSPTVHIGTSEPS